MIDYIVIVEKMGTATRDISIFRLSDINIRLHTLRSKFKMHTQGYIEERNTRSTKMNGTLKIHFLVKGRIQALYGSRLKYKLKQKETDAFGENWVNMKKKY